MFRSATFKLTMWYLAIVMAISLLFSITLYNVTTHELNRGLIRETQRIYNHFPVFQNNPLLQPGPDYDAGAHSILLRLVGLNLIVLVGAGFSSYWLARRTLEPIEAAHEQQKRFTADVSHELRTPLTALRMESEVALLNNKNSSKELRATLSSNLEEVTKLESLINNLLRLTHLEADELEQHFAPVKSSEAIQGAIGQVTAQAKSRKITIDQQLGKQRVQGDRESLVQLSVILLDNAIKYSPSGSTVKVETAADHGQVVWTIADQGNGIAPSALEHVFDRFYRADNSRGKTEAEGYGLGLSIAEMITNAHHGTIELKSRVGQGTTAIVRLPTGQPRQSPGTAG